MELCIGLRKQKSGQGPTRGCRAINEGIMSKPTSRKLNAGAGLAYSFVLKMKAACRCERPVNLQRTARCHVPDGNTLNNLEFFYQLVNSKWLPAGKTFFSLNSNKNLETKIFIFHPE
jgi:hypothetical protein